MVTDHRWSAILFLFIYAIHLVFYWRRAARENVRNYAVIHAVIAPQTFVIIIHVQGNETMAN